MARTKPERIPFDPDQEAGIAGGGFSCLAVLTDDATTTAEINKQGYAFGTVQNTTGSAVTVTYYAAMPSSMTDEYSADTAGTAYALYDQDIVAVTQALASNSVTELPSAVAGVAFLIPRSDTASGDTLIFHFER